MAFLHIVIVVRDVYEDTCQMWIRFSEAKLLLVVLNGLQDLHDISTSGCYESEINQYGREGIFKNSANSSEIDNKTHTWSLLPGTIH